MLLCELYQLGRAFLWSGGGRRMAASDLPDIRPWLVCRSASHSCALPLSSVVETLRPLPVEPLRPAPPFISGISVIRGRPTPVFDLAAFLEDFEVKPTRFVSLSIANRPVALAVSAVRGIYSFAVAAEGTLPPLMRGVARDSVSAVGILDRQLLLFLETSRMIPPEFFEHLATNRGLS